MEEFDLVMYLQEAGVDYSLAGSVKELQASQPHAKVNRTLGVGNCL